MSRQRHLIYMFMAILLLSSSKKHAKKEDPILPIKQGPLTDASFQEIIKRYLFIADFRQKEAERPVSGEIFWRYPFKIPPVGFDVKIEKEILDPMIFQVKGSGRLYEHINKGRALFTEGYYEEAHAAWLGGHQQFHEDVKIRRILEFFMAVNASQLLRESLEKSHNNWDDIYVKKYQQRMAYFLSAAFLRRQDIPNENIDKHGAWAFYNLGATYYRETRWGLVAGASEEGLAFLLKTGEKKYRSKFRQMLAEMDIKNQDMLSAVQELDTAIRQDPEPLEAAKMFNRVGDIYFDLNNYELADDVYALAMRIDENRQTFNPPQALLRAESAFWLGRFEEAQKLFSTAIETAVTGEDTWLLSNGSIAWAKLRLADAWLARLEKEKKPTERKQIAERTRLAYFKVETEHPGSQPARIAAVRGACMELPGYEGNNVRHAREMLSSAIDKADVPPPLTELVWACRTASYSQRERTPEMVEKIHEFAAKYPMSKFLVEMLEPVREVQATNIDPYFQKMNWWSATDFFEKKRVVLFPKISDDLSLKLYRAYVDTSRSDKALEFWPKARGKATLDSELLRDAAFLCEVEDRQSEKQLTNDRQHLITDLERRKWGGKGGANEKTYLSRIMNSAKVKENYIWLFSLIKEWSKEESTATCDVLYPMLSRIYETRQDPAAKSLVKKELNLLMSDKWSAISEKDIGCAQSLIDLESRVFTADELRPLYAAREAWPLKGAWLGRVWSMSESYAANGKKAEARQLWTRIAKEAPESSFESKMAKTRLDPIKTEFESLWQ